MGGQIGGNNALSVWALVFISGEGTKQRQLSKSFIETLKIANPDQYTTHSHCVDQCDTFFMCHLRAETDEKITSQYLHLVLPK